MIHDYRASWVPWPVVAPLLEHLAKLAAEYWLDDARQHGITPLILAPSRHDVGTGTPLEHLAGRYETTTPRGNAPARGPRAVLCWFPDHKTMHLAMRSASGGSLTAVEYPTTPLLGWAIEVVACNLTTGEPTPDSRSASTRELLDRLHFAGNNGWADAPGQRDARQILGQLRASGDLDVGLVVGAMLARGASEAALKRLQQSADRLA